MPKRRMAKIRAWLSLTLFLLIGAMGWRSFYAQESVGVNIFGYTYFVGSVGGEIVVGFDRNPRPKHFFEFESDGFQPKDARSLWNTYHLRAGFGYSRIAGELLVLISSWVPLALALVLTIWQGYLAQKSAVTTGGFEVVYPGSLEALATGDTEEYF